MKPVTGDDKIRPPVEAMKCPRCNSTNTKFCYYNNYSHTQPRHFCKTCRRYWTKGGALRNVPIGGASRKNKIRTTTKSSTSKDYSSSSSSIPSSHFGGLRFGLSPTMDQFLQLGGGISDGGRGGLPFSTFRSSFGKDLSSSTAAAMPASGSFMTSSIESLSYINQDLHWKLQQQRLAMLFGGETRSHKDGDGGGEGGGGGGGGDSLSALPVVLENQILPAQGISKEEVFAVNNNNPMNTKSCISSGATTTEWFFENSYTPTSTTITNNSGSNESNWNGILAWTDLHQYNALP